MNVDMAVPMTAANARRLILLSRTFVMDLPDEIRELAQTDLLTEEQLCEAVPDELFKMLPKEDMLAFCQHALDFDGRFLTITRDPMRAMVGVLGYSYLTGIPMIANTSKAFKNLPPIAAMIEQGVLTFDTLKTKDPDFEESVRLSVVNSFESIDYSKTRKHISLVNSEGSFVGMNYLSQMMFHCHRTIMIANSGNHLVDINSVRGNLVISGTVNTYLETVYPGLKIHQMVSASKPEAMVAQGMHTIHTPTIYRSLGVYYGLNPLI